MVTTFRAAGPAAGLAPAFFGVLGPLVVRSPDGPIDVGEPRRRAVLAALLLEPGHTVPVDRLADLVWGERQPPSSRKSLQVYVSQLRQVLAALPDVELATDRDGYGLLCPPAAVDLHMFRQLVRQARAENDAGRRRRVLGQALGLWRGAAFADTGASGLRARVAPAVDEERLAATEDLYEAELAAGLAGQILAALMASVAEHPLRERMVGLLMRALHHCGRGAEAAQAFRELRRRLVGDAGVEPSPVIAELHRAILANQPVERSVPAAEASPTARPRPPAPVPRQLPARRPNFVGRADALRRLDGLLADAGDVGYTAVLITGGPGIGKSALATHWAYRVLDRFPDGQLFADLRGHATDPPAGRGHAADPAGAIEVLAGFLRALGVPEDLVPADVAEAAATYRSLVARKRMLIVLDDAAAADRVRPLLPGGHASATLVTSRQELTGLVALDGAKSLGLDVFAGDEAYEALAGLIGDGRVRAEPAAAAELARLCARLPLALCIAGARLAGEPRLSIVDYVARLRYPGRLDQLQVDGDARAGVRAAIDASYRRLPPAARHLFRQLGLVPGVVPTAELAGALDGASPAHAGHLLDRLAQAHLLQRGEDGCFMMHDLLRVYAAERGRAEDLPEDRKAATERLSEYYLRALGGAWYGSLRGCSAPYRRHAGAARPAPTVLAAPLAWW